MGRGHFRGVHSGYGTWHTSQVVPWGYITLYQLSYPLLNYVHTSLSQVLY